LKASVTPVRQPITSHRQSRLGHTKNRVRGSRTSAQASDMGKEEGERDIPLRNALPEVGDAYSSQLCIRTERASLLIVNALGYAIDV
jgi:hypothetical protein